MKNLFTFTLLLTLCSPLLAQSDVVELLRSAHAHYKKAEYPQSILCFDSLYEASPSWYNNSFSVIIKRAFTGDFTAIAFIEKYSQTVLPSASTVKPIAIFQKVRELASESDYQQLNIYLLKENHDTLNSSIHSQQLSTQLLRWMQESGDTSHYSSLYFTASFLILEQRGELNPEQLIDWAFALKNLNDQISIHNFKEAPALKLYLDFIYNTALYYQGQYPLDSLLGFSLSPVQLRDIQYFSLVKDTSFYFPSTWEVKKPLIDKGLIDNPEQFWNHAAKLVSSYPTIENLQWLRDQYPKSKEFENFWFNQSQSKWKTFDPDSVVAAYIDSMRIDSQWIVLDTWGTWCGPCVRELPALNEMHEKQKMMDGHPIQFLTLSYHSKDVAVFMDTNQYHFPVLEINKSSTKAMNITGFPTTYLISPTNKFIQLPYMSNKEETSMVFTLLDW